MWTLYIIEIVYTSFLLYKLAFPRLVQRAINHWSVHWSYSPHRLCHLFVIVLIDGCLVLEYNFSIILLFESIWAYQFCQLPLQLDLFLVKLIICSFHSHKKRVIYQIVLLKEAYIPLYYLNQVSVDLCQAQLLWKFLFIIQKVYVFPNRLARHLSLCFSSIGATLQIVDKINFIFVFKLHGVFY